MKVRSLEAARSDELVASYANAAREFGLHCESNTKKTNRAADVIALVYRLLRDRGERELLLVLQGDPDDWVRLWVGSHALEFAPEIGEVLLGELAQQDFGWIRATAVATLEEWRAGRLKFD